MGQKCVRAYRLGLDLGTNSIGWFVIWLDDARGHPVGLGPGGVRIFSDRRDLMSGTSNAADRRKARSARRRRDRFLDRRQQLMAELIRHGLMPAEERDRKALETLDPYELRTRALDGALPVHHVGRALFHLNQRRGFRSNRKADRRHSRPTWPAATTLTAAIAAQGARTLGEFLWWRQQRRETVRARASSPDATPASDLLPSRDLMIDEFNAIWDAQAKHHGVLTPEARERIAGVIFFQRRLEEPPVGKCALSPASRPADQDADGYRCPWAHPLAQRFRIFQSVRDLKILAPGRGERKLTKAEGDILANALLRGRRIGFDKIRTLLGLPPATSFNLEAGSRTGLDGDLTAARLAGRGCFGRAWRHLPLDRRITVVDALLTEESEGALIDWLMSDCGLERAAAEQTAVTPLPEGHCRLGLRAIAAVLPHMEDGLGFHEAAARAGFDPARRPHRLPGPTARLPYYGEWLEDILVGTADPRDPRERRFGRFADPAVHVGLGQLRRIVNALIARHGPPAEIAIEATRALKHSARRNADIRRAQQDGRDRNQARRGRLEHLGLPANAHNLLKLRLWEELDPDHADDRCCPYSGEPIDIDRLMSADVDIDHLIPFSISRDDSAANKIVCMRYANRHKRQRTPFDAFAASPLLDGRHYRWDDIVARAARLPPQKRLRFGIDAQEVFAAAGGYMARQINETGWFARVAAHYLAAVTDPRRIGLVSGRVTAAMRARWKLDSLLRDEAEDDMPAAAGRPASADANKRTKNRTDHRHHAIDAVVIALAERSLLQAFADARDDERDGITVPLPWPSLRADLAAALGRMVVSHKTDHGRAGKLHEDTAYGLVARPELEGANLVYRKPIDGLSESEIDRIRDIRLRDTVRAHVDAATANGIRFAEALRTLGNRPGEAHIKHGLRRVRLLKTEGRAYLVPVRDRDGRVYKAYSAGENYCVDVFETPDGAWRGEAVRRFDANREHRPRWLSEQPGARLVMRLHKGDAVRLRHQGRTMIMMVHRLEAAHGRLKLAAHNETGQLDQRHRIDNNIDPFRWLVGTYAKLKALGAEPIRVDELGRIFRLRGPASTAQPGAFLRAAKTGRPLRAASGLRRAGGQEIRPW